MLNLPNLLRMLLGLVWGVRKTQGELFVILYLSPFLSGQSITQEKNREELDREVNWREGKKYYADNIPDTLLLDQEKRI